ncbi:MAG: IS21-like element helper ATPase IstB [Balneolales bacterium]
MNTSKTEQLMNDLRLAGMLDSWQSILQTRSHQELSLVEGLQQLLQAEWLERGRRRVQRLTKNAGFRYQASLEELSYSPSRGLDRNTIALLADGNYIDQGQAILVSGRTGSGKSFLASALGHQACQLGYRVGYYNMQKLIHGLVLARADGSILKLLEKIARTQLLILDDFGLKPLDSQQRLDLLDIVEDRHRKMATIIASQLPVANWYDVIGESTIADAILDRLVHTAHRIELDGESMRKKM